MKKELKDIIEDEFDCSIDDVDYVIKKEGTLQNVINCIDRALILKIMEEITKELLETIRWIPQRERQGRWYKEYLDKINKDLKDEMKIVSE